nr:FecR domain-containing protein [Robiginitalea sp. SC105]
MNGELSDAELKAFRETPEFKAYERIASFSSRLEGPGFDTEAALARVKSARPGTGGKVVRLQPAMRWLSIAAAVILMLAAGYYYVNTLDASVEAAYAQRQEVRLPDASEVLLNAGTELTYSKNNWDRERHVRLSGEAFFKVAKGKTFTVETASGDVTVLGTQFNVLQRGDVFIVSCYEGLVRVDHQGQSIELPAGSAYRVEGGAALKSETVESEVPSWTGGETAFRSMPMSFVIDEFRRQYNMEVETRGVDLSRRYTGTISNTNMNLALQSISAPMQLKYEVEGNKVLLYAENAP